MRYQVFITDGRPELVRIDLIDQDLFVEPGVTRLRHGQIVEVADDRANADLFTRPIFPTGIFDED